MKALVLTGVREFEYKDVPMPKIGDDEVLVQVKAAAICGSDVRGADGSTGRRRTPIIMGHEASGVIAELGSRVKRWKVGDRVIFDSTIYCGECSFCRAGMVNLCEGRNVLGVHCAEYSRDGAMAEYVAVPQRVLYRIPEGVSFEMAAMVEPFAVGTHAISLSPIKLGDRVTIIGIGTIGLLMLQALKAAGASEIIAINRSEHKKDIALQLGATRFIKMDENTADEVKKLTETGVDVVYDLVGSAQTLNAAIDSLRLGGTIVMVANASQTLELPLHKCINRQITLTGSCASAGEYEICLRLLASGQVDLAPILSKVAPLKDGPEWFDRLYNRDQELIKVVLTP